MTKSVKWDRKKWIASTASGLAMTVYVDSAALEKFNVMGLDLEAYINSQVRAAVAE